MWLCHLESNEFTIYFGTKIFSYYAQFANLTCYFPLTFQPSFFHWEKFQNGGLCDKSEYRICREYFVLGVWQEARLFSTKYIMDKQHPWPWHAAERWIWLFLCSCMAWRNNSWAGIWVFKLLWLHSECRLSAWIMHYTVFQCYVQHKDRDVPKCKPYLYM